MKCPVGDCDFETEKWSGMSSHLRSHELGDKSIEDKWQDVRSFIAKGGMAQSVINSLQQVEATLESRLEKKEEVKDE